ncbi:TenA family protein [Pararhodospirillum photometricum]|nr:TenA family protein [Pararhodospirillum photometricum]
MTVPPGSLFERLRTACTADWQAYVDHAFVRAMGAGTLPEASFRHYLGQDALFLIHFARAYALAAFKADTLDDIRAAGRGMTAILDEMGLHVAFCRRWGLSESALQALPEARATLAYTRYVLERGLAGDVLDLFVALAPCVVGYAEIGRALAPLSHPGHPYAEWIDQYAGEAYQGVAADAMATLDGLFARRGGEGRMPELIRTFRDATRLEADFWEMGWTLAS